MKKNPLISVIIPTYNFSKYIVKCIESIQAQDYTNIEIIIINDGSTDNTQEILDHLQSKDPNLKIINKKNEGVSIARNVGIENAKGEYIVFVDGDDYLSKDAISYLTSLVVSTSSDFGVSTKCFTKEKEFQVEKEDMDILTPNDAVALLLSPALIVGCWNKIFKKSLLIQNNIRFNPELFYGEGLRFINQVAQKSNQIVVGNRKVYFYRRNNYSSATSAFNIEKFQNGLKSIELIEKDIPTNWTAAKQMIEWHKCQFYMGIVIRVKEANHPKGTTYFYNHALRKLRQDAHKFLFLSTLPLYNRLILVGTSISPSLFAWLDKKRRKAIAARSVE